MHNNGNDAVIYCRVSSIKQLDSGDLQRQKCMLLKYARDNGLKVQLVYEFMGSAYDWKNRRFIKSMIRYLEKEGITNLLVTNFHRITRHVKNAALIYDWLERDGSRRIHSVEQDSVLGKNASAEEKLEWDILMLFDRFYLDQISKSCSK